MQGIEGSPVKQCGGCGYPTVGEGMCAFCQSVIVLAPTNGMRPTQAAAIP